MRGHFLLGLRLRRFLGGEGTEDRHGGDPLLQQDAQLPVLLLNALVQALEHSSEKPGENKKQHAAGDQDGGDARVDHDEHDEGADELDHHADEPGQDLDHVVRDDLRVVRQAVVPLGGVNGADGRVVLVHELTEKTAFERVFQIRLAELIQPAEQRTQSELGGHEKQRIERVAPEKHIVLPHGRVHDGAQQQGIKNP